MEGAPIDAMLCYRCAQVYVTDALLCPSCSFIMVGVKLRPDDTVTVYLPKPPMYPKAGRRGLLDSPVPS